MAEADGTRRSGAADAGTLYLVPTPIGHPGDITLRAIEVLGRVGVVASEDTRHTRRLLQSLEIDTRLLSYHDHNEESRSQQLLGLLREGTDVALVSDAGTPLVNDPGYRLVVAAVEADVPVRPLPGATASVTALIGSGLPNHQFHYVGFLPRKEAARRTALTSLRSSVATLVFFEAPHRIVAMLEDVRAVLGDRPAALARNLTKDDEEFLRGPLSELVARLDAEAVVRGQFTVVVAGAGEEPADEEHALAHRLTETLMRHGADSRLVREVVREVTGLPRNWVYEQVRLAAQQRDAGAAERPVGAGRSGGRSSG
ncbi:16S rRNA (cytidine(1402)-2'-O)-methyltransferase [Micromonospora sp. NBRC 101691]|uniref:16S rRNA (cytidine(1402)-2'-O)-methyltransferase n=1 Tax=Micromonospora sp. NBRC 101691 TaxID=3032198 RepID=UPI00249FEE50|nr:16S rRNA (cytidine(1402)-2'-O)-methyltransferase [Micromonospora sp. NBRC 101691]GLY25640.1 ribosomal RNA small subunit methyltransferase I [Micromonospora sp. NBRC 101691]